MANLKPLPWNRINVNYSWLVTEHIFLLVLLIIEPLWLINSCCQLECNNSLLPVTFSYKPNKVSQTYRCYLLRFTFKNMLLLLQTLDVMFSDSLVFFWMWEYYDGVFVYVQARTGICTSRTSCGAWPVFETLPLRIKHLSTFKCKP